MHYTYGTHGTCSRQIDFDIDAEGRLHNVSFLGGCNGNLKGIGGRWQRRWRARCAE